MIILNCHLGLWKACALVEEMAHNKLMAIIKVLDKDDNETISSHHIVVFDRRQDGDALLQTQEVMQELLAYRYSA